MEDLLEGYRLTRRGLRALRTLATIPSDREIICNMINDCTWAIFRMESGSYPRRRRAWNRVSYWQRTVFLEPDSLERMANRFRKDEDQSSITPEQRDRIDEMMNLLTDRERDCFTAVYGEGFSFGEVAEVLNISKSSVGTYINRAKKKFAKWT